MISTKDISILNNIYRWLYDNGAKINSGALKIPTDWNFKGLAEKNSEVKNKDLYLIRVAGNNGVARVDDFQYVTNFTQNIRSFVVKDVLRNKADDFNTENIYGLEFYTSNTWIVNNKSEKNYLMDSYYDYENKIAKSPALANWKKDFLKANASLFFELFQKEDETNFVKNLDKIGMIIIENTLIDELERNKNYVNYPYCTINSMNLWIAYKQYFKKEGEVDEEMKINNVQSQCFEIYTQNKQIESDEQYYFLAGQVAFYLLNQSKASKLTQDVTAPFIKAANIKRLKEELKYLYEKYNYELYLNNPKFNNILSQLLLQEPETKVKDNKDIILAGMLANNLFYTKKDIDNGGNEDGENE